MRFRNDLVKPPAQKGRFIVWDSEAIPTFFKFFGQFNANSQVDLRPSLAERMMLHEIIMFR
jgi:hypothetical protein